VIRGLRKRHGVMFALLALVVAPLLVAGLLARRPVPTLTAPFAGVEPFDHDPAQVVARKVQSWERGAFRLTVWRDAGLRATLESLDEAEHPELLIYWAETPPDEDWKPVEGRLLGRLAGRFPVSFDLPSGDGRLVLYSLSQREPLAVLEPPPLCAPAGNDG